MVMIESRFSQLGGWHYAEPHYFRVLRKEKGKAVRKMLDEGFEGDFGRADLGDTFNLIRKVDGIICPAMNYLSDKRSLVDVIWIYRIWLLNGCPLFKAGPIMDQEFVNMGQNVLNASDFSSHFERLITRLPFEMFYVETTTDNNVTMGAYIFLRHTTEGENNIPVLAIAIDSGCDLSLNFIFDDNGTLKMVLQPEGFFDLDRVISEDDASQLKKLLHRMLVVVLGLLRYLESKNKDIEDRTPQIKEALLSDKKSKRQKALNRLAGKRKIWIEPTLEQKAKSHGITGEKLTNGHVRRGHLHTYYTGARLDADGLKIPAERRKKVVKFVAPTWVGPRTITTEPKEYGIRASR